MRTCGIADSCANAAALPWTWATWVSPLRIESASAGDVPARRNRIWSGRRLTPEPVVAGEQDLVALRVDALHPEDAPVTGSARPAGPEPARHVPDDVGGHEVGEQLTPGRVGLGEGDHRRLAALDRLDPGDQVVAGGVDDAGLTDHLRHRYQKSSAAIGALSVHDASGRIR